MVALRITPLCAQDLAPRAYLITPLHANAVTLTWSFYNGGVNFNGTVPITGATGVYNVPVFSYYHSFNLLGRSANLTASLPYGVGTFSGEVLGKGRSVYRSGLLDFSARLSVNLLEGSRHATPAVRGMEAEDIARCQPEGSCSDRAVRPDQAHQLGNSSVGI